MNTVAVLQAALTRGIGDAALKKILAVLRERGYTYEEFDAAPAEVFAEAGLKPEQVEGFREARSRAEKLSQDLLDQRIELFTEIDRSYPQYLKRSLGAQCPPLLYVKGNDRLLHERAVGFCGSRKASPKGIGIAKQCAEQLAKGGIAVVSGYASGVDMAAHAAAMASGGSTLFILAEGILRSTVKREIRDAMSDENHVFISQFPPTIAWSAGNAMKRNNVIIGLSRAMILVESGRSGGTYDAGYKALKMGCPLFVVDFEAPSDSAAANPEFIAAGGQPIRGVRGVPQMSKVFEAVNGDRAENPFMDGTNKQLRFLI